ncbi:mosquitocidal toxin [Fusarium longipes]|uniref:Mosquitocidal toxin n=1 Tax=Fusarium longipes TaxID=694270 RepID=A0A395RZB7_9HYPO|nr:mosquitocidal toxin [Fusarium longipes]
MKKKLLSLIGLVTVSSASTLFTRDQSTFIRREILDPLPQNASSLELEFQPLLDFDMDGCYNTAAMDPKGRTNSGLGPTASPQGRCRDRIQLENANVYSRSRCNNGYCAIMYEYYFEKDQSVGFSFLAGHRHDWENVVVFVKDGEIIRVVPACHGKYGPYKEAPAGTWPEPIKYKNAIPLKDNHPMIVYHRHGGGTHCLRLAHHKDVKDPENPFKAFHRAPLVGWKYWSSMEFRDKMLDAWEGHVGPNLDDEFSRTLEAATGGALPDFDPFVDDPPLSK